MFRVLTERASLTERAWAVGARMNPLPNHTDEHGVRGEDMAPKEHVLWENQGCHCGSELLEVLGNKGFSMVLHFHGT